MKCYIIANMEQHTTSRIETNIQSIIEVIDHKKALSQPYSLIASKGSLALFNVYCYKHFKNATFQTKALELIENSIQEINETPIDFSLAHGYSGFGWLIQHLANINFLKPEEVDILTDLDEIIYESLEVDLEKKNYDLLYGLVGKGIYFHERHNSPLKEAALERIESILYEISVKYHPDSLYWLDQTSIEYDNTRGDKALCNLGLAHGIAGIISFLALIYSSSNNKDLLFEMISKSSQWLTKQKLMHDGSIFPAFSDEKDSSRLAWCQGDLGIYKALTDAQRITGNKSLTTHALEVASHTIERDYNEAFVDYDNKHMDITFCHGTSGIYHMMNRMGHKKSAEAKKFDSRKSYWLDLTLSSVEKNIKNGTPPVLASIYDEKSKTLDWQENYGIIQGASGVGLVLLSSINTTFKYWDRFLLTDVQ